MLSKFLYLLWKPFLPGSDTRPTQVGDMDPWHVTWPNLSDLIGWGQKISSTSWSNAQLTTENYNFDMLDGDDNERLSL